ncbi:MAG: hypothetical protein RLO18_23070, partial [Gimesia chilikensis]
MSYLPQSSFTCLLALLLTLLLGCEGQSTPPATTETATDTTPQSTAQTEPEPSAEKTPAETTGPEQPTVKPDGKQTPVAAGHTPAKSEKTPPKSSDTPPPKPIFEGWPTPKLAIVLTGERHGYLEPCGCTQNQTGGVSLLANLFKQIEDRKWPVTAFDLGGLVKRNRRQSQIK